MKYIYKPLFLSISIILATGSSVVEAKPSLVKNVVKHPADKKHSAHEPPKGPAKHLAAKQQAPVESTKSPKNTPIHASSKHPEPKLVHIAKNATKAVQDKTPNKSLKEEKSVAAPVLDKYADHKHNVRHLLRPIGHGVASKDQAFEIPLHKHKGVSVRHPGDNEDFSDSRLTQLDRTDVESENDNALPQESSDQDQPRPSSEQNHPILGYGKLRTTFYKIKPGDTLPRVFESLNLNTYDLHKIIHNRKLGRQFKSLMPGKTLCINTNARGELTSLAYKSDSFDQFMATKDHTEDGTEEIGSAEASSIESSANAEMPVHNGLTQVKHISAHGIIQSSLEQATRSAGMPKKVTKQLMDIFAWDIDFSQNLRANDQFTVVYERVFANGRAVDHGDIVAAEFITQGQKHQAVRYKDNNGVINYYTPEGDGMRRAFLRNPLDFARISSFFNPNRRHPVLNRIRAHKGVDYAASTGTPIKATGDGKVVYQGRKGGYGQVVMIEHGNDYTTLYAHMSDFSEELHEGDSVRQGQVIGYVGETGLATGPHLHYEFLVNGVHQDPLTVKLPNTMPINRALLSYFKLQTRPLLAQLEQARTTMLARYSQNQVEE